MLTDAEIAARYVKIRPYLDERQRRLWLGVEAQALGSGGVAVIARATGADVKTVRRGTAEIESGAEPGGRVRGPGGGRPGLPELDAGLVPALEALVDPATRGDPMSPLRWTTKSTAHLASELTGQGHAVTARTVASLLAGAGYSLQGNAKTIEGKQHPDRDAQFRYINAQVTAFQDDGSPVISVDAKKKENVGNFRNGGAESGAGRAARAGQRPRLPRRGAGQGHPVRDLRPDREHRLGQRGHRSRHRRVRRRLDPLLVERTRPGRLPRARRLLVTADSGGSNGSRLRLWKTELAAFAAKAGLDITVLHLPPGTSKWNKIEHRLFSAITMNWRGRPLVSHEVIIETISAVTTRTGLKVTAVLDTGIYPKGIRIPDKDMKAFEARHLQRHQFHGNWNYTIPADPPGDTTRPNEGN